MACSLIAAVGPGVVGPVGGVADDKDACCCPSDARAVLYGSLRAALYVCSVCGGCHALLAPLVPLGAVGGASHYPANCVVGGKSACYHLPNARAMLYGGTRTALHM